jgi:hypothetical protein
VLLHPRQVVIDRIRGRGGRSWSVHAPAELVLDGSATGGVVARRGPACCYGNPMSAEFGAWMTCTRGEEGRIWRTEHAGHYGDAGVLWLALGIVHAEGLERREPNWFVPAGHGG